MKLERGAAILEPTDDGLTVYKALRDSLQTVRPFMPDENFRLWTNAVLNAKGALQSNYTIVNDEVIFPDSATRNTPLYMSPDDLEFVLIAYGVEDMEKHNNATTPDTVAINGLLREIDRIKA